MGSLPPPKKAPTYTFKSSSNSNSPFRLCHQELKRSSQIQWFLEQILTTYFTHRLIIYRLAKSLLLGLNLCWLFKVFLPYSSWLKECKEWGTGLRGPQALQLLPSPSRRPCTEQKINKWVIDFYAKTSQIFENSALENLTSEKEGFQSDIHACLAGALSLPQIINWALLWCMRNPNTACAMWNIVLPVTLLHQTYLPSTHFITPIWRYFHTEAALPSLM